MDMTGPMHSISAAADAPCDSSAMLYAKSRASKVLCLRTRQMRGEARHHRSWEGVVPNVHGAVVRNQSYQLARLEVCCGYQPPQASIPHFVDLHILDLHAHTVALSSLNLLANSRFDSLWSSCVRMVHVRKVHVCLKAMENP